MSTFEDFGRKLDGEIARLRDIAEHRIVPATRRQTAKSLRRISEKLAQVAAELDSKVESKADSH